MMQAARSVAFILQGSLTLAPQDEVECGFLLRAFEQPLHFDMDALAGCRAMTLARGEKGARLFGAFRLDEPFLDARHHDRRVEGTHARL
jgi:hypothetical protein